MGDLHRARARAEEFARAVDNGSPYAPRSVDDPELRAALDLVDRLRAAGAVTPSPEFSANLRQRLLAEAAGGSGAEADDDEASGTPSKVSSIGHRGRRRLRVVAGTAVLAVFAGGIGSAAAAQQAVPGDTLYGVKRGIESVAAGVSVGDDSRGRRELDHAMTRLSEVSTLVEHKAAAGPIDDTLREFSLQARSGARRLVTSFQEKREMASMDALNVFTEEARTALVELSPKVPADARAAANEALATVQALAEHSATVCPTCIVPSTSTTRLPTADLSPTPGVTLFPDGKPTSSFPPPGRTTDTLVPPTLAVTGRPADRPTGLPPTLPTIVAVTKTPRPSDTLPTYQTPTLPTPTPGETPTLSWPSLPYLTLPTITIPLPPLITLTFAPPPRR